MEHGSGFFVAAYALQGAGEDQHSSAGLDSFHSPAGAVHSGATGSSRFSHSAPHHEAARTSSHHSIPRSIPSTTASMAASDRGSPSLSPLGSLSPPPSPTHHLTPRGSQHDSRSTSQAAAQLAAPAAACMEGAISGRGAGWEIEGEPSPHSQPSLTFATLQRPQQCPQSPVLGGTPLPGSPSPLPQLSMPQQQGQQQHPHRTLSPDSVALLACVAAADASQRASVQSGSAASFHHLPHMLSYGYGAPSASEMQRRVTSSTVLSHQPLHNAAAAGLAAAGAAAAEVTRLQLAAGDRQRRQAADLKDEQQAAEELAGAGAAGGGAHEEGQEGEEGEGGKLLSAEPSGSQRLTSDGDELGLVEMAEGRQVPWYKRLGFWGRAVSLGVSLTFFLAGIVALVVWPDVKLAGFNLWRWFFFLGCWPIIYWGSVWTMWALTKFCECRLFSARTAVYFLVGTRGALMLVMRSCLVLAAFAALFQTQPDLDNDATVQKVFQFLIKLLGCAALMTVGNLIKKVVIKLLAAHFHKEAHFQRMQEALRKEYFLSILSQPREHRDSMNSQAQGAAMPSAKSFAKRWLSRQLISKSAAAMHSLPTMVRSFSRHHRKRSQSDSLLVDGRQLSDGAMAGLVGEHASMVRMSAAKAAGSQAVEKSNQSATAALTSINVVASAGVEASFRSMPNLERVSRMVGHSHGSIHGPSHLAPHAQHQPQPQHLLQHLQRQSGGPEAAHTAGNVAGSAGSQQAPRRSDLQSRLATGAAAAVTDHSPLRPASRLSRSVVAGFQGGGGTSIDGDEDLTPAAGGCPLPPGQQQPARPHLARQLGLLPLTRGSAHGGEGQGGDAGASEAAALRQLRFSLASRQHSGVSSSLAAARQSYAFRARDASRQGSLASLHSLRGDGGKTAPPLQQLLDLEQTREQLRARHRRTSIVQMPPEELEKMHHIEKHIRKNQLKFTLTDQLGKGQAGVDDNELEAKRVAFYLYHNLRASRKRKWIQQSDLEDFLPPQQAAEAFLYLDIDGNGRISAREVRESVVNIFQERAHLALTLRDTKSVISKLERLLGAIIHTLFIFFYLAIFKIDVTQAWLTFSSIMLAFTFIFGNSIRTIFECVVWLFVVHPYDVGDTLVITGENHKVEEITLLNTVLSRWDGGRIYFPNSRLNTEQLLNLSRSSNKGETLKLSLDLSTSLEIVEMLRASVEDHVKGNPTDFSGASSVNVRALGDPMKLAIGIYYEYSHNGVDAGRCSRARSALYMVVAAALNAAHVQFTLPPFQGDPSTARAHTALEAQAELTAGMGLTPILTAAA
ncbi:hypothetical protein D9Q98_007280 [Chlorella vulgaris]|uniref:EF-hand domain-containing protein n=1 Tax=Chlorella vulgaris TaxID=3077 RepID=A0A9D4TKZ6_CHLVU|nr:hypothetical protein D9Q98_007280 [Chlorella vulgaris]